MTVGEVVRVLETGLQLADCGNCVLRDDYAACPMLAKALGAFLEVLDSTTLADAAVTGTKAFAPWTDSGT